MATRLAAADGVRVILYTVLPAAPDKASRPYVVHDLSGERAHLSAPLPGRGDNPLVKLSQLAPEDFQVNRLLLLARVQDEVADRPGDRHLIMSFFFLSNLGFTAQLVAQELGIPHVAFVAGSDLNRDGATPTWMAALAFVVGHADWIVVSNRDQATRLERLFQRTDRISLSHGALPDGSPRAHWQPHRRDHVRLVSDCGYSFKKSTHTLVDAFDRLRREGFPVRLEIVGGTERIESKYWETARRRWGNRFRDDAIFGAYVPKRDVEDALLAGDVYCSASLGEGSSNGALLALIMGMPIVAVRSSSLADLVDPACDRVALFHGGDRSDLHRCLVDIVTRVREDWGRPIAPRSTAFATSLPERKPRIGWA